LYRLPAPSSQFSGRSACNLREKAQCFDADSFAFKAGGAFFRTAIRGRARLLLPYKADFRWYGAMPSQRSRRFGTRCRRLGHRGLARHRYFTGLFFAVDISARGNGLLHIDAPVVVGVTAYEGTKEPGFQTRERPPIETDSSHCVDTPNSKPHLLVARGTIVDADMCIGSFRRCVDACGVHIFPAPTHGPFS
jgi:hypothetical protein